MVWWRGTRSAQEATTEGWKKLDAQQGFTYFPQNFFLPAAQIMPRRTTFSLQCAGERKKILTRRRKNWRKTGTRNRILIHTVHTHPHAHARAHTHTHTQLRFPSSNYSSLAYHRDALRGIPAHTEGFVFSCGNTEEWMMESGSGQL